MELGSTGENLWSGRLARTPFAAALARGVPLFIATGEPPRVVFATPATLAAFGVRDAQALTAVLFEGDGARGLVRLASDMPQDAPPRLERLPAFDSYKPADASWLCARLSRDGDVFFVAADAKALQHDAREESAAPPPEPPARFLWRLDAAGRFDAPDSTLVERFGPFAPGKGEALAALAARLGLDADWTERVASRETFTKLAVLWPEPPGERGRIVLVSGAPAFSGVHRGFRGFGLLTGERRLLAQRPKTAADASGPRIPAAAKPVAGDAAALLHLLHSQNTTSGAAATAPALAIIAALAALLQPKAAVAEAKAPVPPPAPRAPPPSTGAEIVVLRPNAQPSELKPGDSVALTSKERDAFKEIARALGVAVRPGRPDVEAVEEDNPVAAEAEPPAGPTEADLAALLDILPTAVLVARDGEALYANRALLDLTGYPDLAGFRAQDGIKSLFRGRDPKALAPGEAVAGIPLVAVDGRLLTVDAQVLATVWRGEAADLVAMRRSREAEHQAQLRAMEREAAMHAARARDFAAALDAACDGMVRIDRGGRILGLNRGAEALLGYDQKEAAGDSFLALFAPPSHAAASAALESLARGEGDPFVSAEVVARHREGRLIPARIQLGRLAGQPAPDFFVLLTDRTDAESGAIDSKAALEEAERRSTAKTETLTRVSHEIRTPLHAILGFAEVILEERFGPIGAERYREYLRDIHASGRHVLSLVNDLLDFTKIELGKNELEFAPLDVNAIVRECVSLMQPQAARERVIVRLSLYERLPNVMADARSLRQIMLNLMTNAVKYNEPGGQVIVSTALDDASAVVIRVRDTGIGMNDSDLALALEPFGRAPGSKSIEGTGLGLPLTKALVEANQADFSIKSRKDQGTLVEIAFPPRRAAQ